MKKKKPLTREEFFKDKSSMSAPMVFTIQDGESKTKIIISKEGVKKKPIN